jgi:hypothetical protein
MKNKLLQSTALALGLMLSLSTFAQQLPAVIDLKKEGDRFIGNQYIRKIDSNESIVYRFEGGPKYVEELMISAEGAQRNYSFAKVYADGEEIALLGVPGRDPDYPIIVRGDVSEITVKAQNNSKIKILGFKIYTARKNYSSYSSQPMTSRRQFSIEDWGGKTVDLVHEFMINARHDGSFGIEAFNSYLKALKLAGLNVQASENARDSRSLSTHKKAEILLDAIDASLPLFESDRVLLDTRYDRLALDLLTIKQDIIEKYDLSRE